MRRTCRQHFRQGEDSDLRRRKLEGEKDVPNNGPVMVWNDNNIEIGGRPDTNGGANLYKGLLDKLAVYDRALTEAEVVTVMNAKDILTVDVAGKLTTTWGALKMK